MMRRTYRDASVGLVAASVLSVFTVLNLGCGVIDANGILGLETCDILNCDGLFFGNLTQAGAAAAHDEEGEAQTEVVDDHAEEGEVQAEVVDDHAEEGVAEGVVEEAHDEAVEGAGDAPAQS